LRSVLRSTWGSAWSGKERLEVGSRDALSDKAVGPQATAQGLRKDEPRLDDPSCMST